MNYFSNNFTYCVSVGLLPAKILCGPDFCKLHKQEVSRNVVRNVPPSRLLSKSLSKKLLFLQFPSFHHLGLFYLLVKIYIRLLTIMLELLLIRNYHS
jgi:hypothetical protein